MRKSVKLRGNSRSPRQFNQLQRGIPSTSDMSTQNVCNSLQPKKAVKDEVIDNIEEHTYESKGRAIEVLQEYNNLRTANVLCDITLCVGGMEFPCHKIALVASSPYFKAMFTGLMASITQKTVYLKDVDPEAFKELLEFIYTSKIVINANNVHSLLAAANLLQISGAKEFCCMFLENQLNMEDCFSIHHLADTYNCPSLYDKARDFMIEHFSKLNIQQDFLKLSSKALVEVISSDLLDVKNEEAVFEFIALWNRSNPEQRNKHFHEVLEHVRLTALSPYFLCQQVKQFPAVKKCTKCQSLVEDAKQFHFLPELKAKLRPEWTRFRKCDAFQEVIISMMPCRQQVPPNLIQRTGYAQGIMVANNAMQVSEIVNIDLFLVNSHCAVPKVSFGTTLKPLQMPHKLQGIAALGNTLYLIGGETTNGAAISTVDKYVLEYDLWIPLARMAVPRSQPGIVILYGDIYAIGGRNGTEWMNSVECYNPGMNTWEKGIDMPMALQHVTSVAFKGCIYAAGIPVSTLNLGSEYKDVAVMLRYSSTMKSWFELPPMPCPCYGATAYVTNSQICLIGGKNIALESTRTVQSYNPKDNSWSIQSSVLMQHYRPGVVVVNGVTFVGYDNSYLEQQGMFEYKCEKSDTWLMEVQDSKKDYVQWTRCAVLQIRKDTLESHSRKYQSANAQRTNI